MKGNTDNVKSTGIEAERVADRAVDVRRNLSEARDGGEDRVRERDIELLVGLLPELGQVVQGRVKSGRHDPRHRHAAGLQTLQRPQQLRMRSKRRLLVHASSCQ